MIDFRYHLVSLISVFMALAVGIVLGAGPLKEAIGDTLTGEVDELRTRAADLRAELDETTADLNHAEVAFDEVAPALLDGVLDGRRVAVIELADVVPDVHEQVVDRLEQAGASVTAQVEVAEAWTDPGQGSFRRALAGNLLDHLDPVPDEAAGTDRELAEALVQALTRPEPTDPDVLAEQASILRELLTEGGLVEVDGGDRPVDAIVVLAGPTVTVQEAQEVQEQEQEEASQDPQEAAAAQERLEALFAAGEQIGLAAQDRSTGAVVAGGEVTDQSLVRHLRQTEDAVETVSTVDAVNTVMGQIGVPLALSARISGTVGHYGTGPGVSGLMPERTVLPPLVRVPLQSETPPDGEDAETPDGDGDDEATGAADGEETADAPDGDGEESVTTAEQG